MDIWPTPVSLLVSLREPHNPAFERTHGRFACNGVAVHAVSRAPLNKAFVVREVCVEEAALTGSVSYPVERKDAFVSQAGRDWSGESEGFDA